MNQLTRILELLGTQDRVHISLTKYSPRLYTLAVNNLDDVHAQGSDTTLEVAVELLVASCERVGLLHDESPRTQPPPPPDTAKRTCNRHFDCDAADDAARAAGRRTPDHCHAEDCEECFGC